MKQETIQQIFLNHNLGKINKIEKIAIGFTNKIYSIDDKYILKVYDNQKNFQREICFYDFFKDQLAVPKIIVHQENYLIYHKIKGDNLYSKWHLMNTKQRKSIVKQLCNSLKIINQAPHQGAEINWQEHILEKINTSLNKIKQKKTISLDFIQAIEKFVFENKHVLIEQKLALVYWDAHFDNILVQDNKIVGVLDFERTQQSSIDFGLDIIKRMQEYPKKYMSEESEKFCQAKDYANLLEWFKEFYPELFNFKNLNRRLDLYAIEHDLNTLLDWPDSDEVKQMIVKTINYK